MPIKQLRPINLLQGIGSGGIMGYQDEGQSSPTYTPSYGPQAPEDFDQGFSRPGPETNPDPGFTRYQPDVTNDQGFERFDEGWQFGGPDSISVKPPSVTPIQEIRQKSWMDRMNEFKPETRATDRFNSLIDNPPEVNDIGWGRALFAGLGAFTSKGDHTDAQNKVLYAPYMRDLAAWKESVGPAQQAAQLENTANVNNRTLFNNAMQAELAQQKIDDTNQYNKDRIRVSEARNDILRLNQLYSAKGVKWDFSGEEAMMVFPDNTRQGSGILSKDIDTPTRLALQAGSERVGAAAPSGRGTSDINNVLTDESGASFELNPNSPTGYTDMSGRPYTPKGRPYKLSQWQNPDARGTSGANEELDPKKAGEQLDLNLRQILMIYPQYRDFIIPDGKGSYTVAPPPQPTLRAGSQTDNQRMLDYNQMRKLINPKISALPVPYPESLTTEQWEWARSMGVPNIPAANTGGGQQQPQAQSSPQVQMTPEQQQQIMQNSPQRAMGDFAGSLFGRGVQSPQQALSRFTTNANVMNPPPEYTPPAPMQVSPNSVNLGPQANWGRVSPNAGTAPIIPVPQRPGLGPTNAPQQQQPQISAAPQGILNPQMAEQAVQADMALFYVDRNGKIGVIQNNRQEWDRVNAEGGSVFPSAKTIAEVQAIITQFYGRR